MSRQANMVEGGGVVAVETGHGNQKQETKIKKKKVHKSKRKGKLT
jgi:hypothetical protein